MGVKRNVDTGRKDKLGRPIKVSAHKNDSHNIKKQALMDDNSARAQENWDAFNNGNLKAEIMDVMTAYKDVEEEFWSTPEAIELLESMDIHFKERWEYAGDWEYIYHTWQGKNGWMGDPDDLNLTDKQVPHSVRAMNLEEEFKDNYKYLCKNYGRPIKARTRWVWYAPNENKVYKMFINEEGLVQASDEITDSQHPDGVMVETSLADFGEGMVIQSGMVTYIDSSDPDYPSWALSVDCGQVGRDIHGNIVAYDL